MKIKYLFFIIFLIPLISLKLLSQESTKLQIAEKELAKYGKQILNGKNDSIKEYYQSLFQKKLIEALETEYSFEHGFHSLVSIARLSSPDGSFKIFNWHIPYKDGRYKYYGIIQVKINKEKSKLYLLTDSSYIISAPEQRILNTKNWYGAHYYKIIYNKHKRTKYYTLLGWHGNNRFTTKKIIDVISFKDNVPSFGSPIFEKNDIYAHRIIFEYMSKSAMSLKYEEQSYFIFKKKIKRKKKNHKYKPVRNQRNYLSQKQKKQNENFKEERCFMIIFDRLSPLSNHLEGIYQYYAPESNIFDAYIFNNGKWYFEQDIDARNPENKSAKNKTKKVKQGLIEK